jgi:hypothetical protein
MLRIEDDLIADLRFKGQGCSISQAAVSMMTEKLRGAALDDAVALERRFLDLMHGDESAGEDRALGDLRALQGVAKLPMRIKCALLGFNALDEAIRAYHQSDHGLMGAKLTLGAGQPGPRRRRRRDRDGAPLEPGPLAPDRGNHWSEDRGGPGDGRRAPRPRLARRDPGPPSRYASASGNTRHFPALTGNSRHLSLVLVTVRTQASGGDHAHTPG